MNRLHCCTLWGLLLTLNVLSFSSSRSQTGEEGISKRLLGRIDSTVVMDRESFVFSPDGRHLAYGVVRSGEQWVVHDGVEHAHYAGVLSGTLRFSQDSKRLTYLVRDAEKVAAVVDGQPGKWYSFIGDGGARFSNDGKACAYAAAEGDKWFVVLNGKELTHYDDITFGMGAFSGPRNHFLYPARRGTRWCIVSGEKEGKLYDILGIPIESSDGKRMAYCAKLGGKWRVVVNGREGPLFDSLRLGTLRFTPSGVAYIAASGKKWQVVKDGDVLGPFDDCSGIQVSPDGKRGAFFFREGKRWGMVVDGVKGSPGDSVFSNGFSEDGKLHLYAIRDRKTWSIMVNGRPEGPYRDIVGPEFLGKGYAYCAQRGKLWSVKVNGTWGRGYDEIFDCRFYGPDIEDVTYIAREDSLYFAVRGKTEGKRYDYISFGPILSARKSRMAYAALKDGKWAIVVDGKESGSYDETRRIVFSHDEKRIAYSATIGDSAVAIIDGRMEGVFNRVGDPVFSPDDRCVAYYAISGTKAVMIVNGRAVGKYDAIDEESVEIDSNSHLNYVAIADSQVFAVEHDLAQESFLSVSREATIIGGWKPETLTERWVYVGDSVAYRLSTGLPWVSSPRDETGPVLVFRIPVPPKACVKVMPKYPEVAMRAGLEGSATVHIRVDHVGRPKALEIGESISYIFRMPALQAAQQWRFTPHSFEDLWISIPFTYRLQDHAPPKVAPVPQVKQ